ncbi:uncharacterized protein K02A2.6-like [Armigeres subalbatus]|uniref:uncharacterized protein K02A2.6-like n=1 Tax=Armigeres subalbatus TaxID=124917 RepID=UPI002ED6A16F
MSSIRVQIPPNPEIILDSLANNIKEFLYEPESSITFAAWYARYDDLFEKDTARLDDEAKVRLLMRKLGAVEHERYVSFILPKVPKVYTFDETVQKLKTLSGAIESVVSKRYRCFQTAKQSNEDFISFACRINKNCVEFELSKMSEEQFKCLMFVCGLKSEGDGEVRTRLLSKIEERADVTLEQLSEDCQRLLCLKHDTAMIEAPQSAAVQFLKKKKKFNKLSPMCNSSGSTGTSAKQKLTVPSTPCWCCGAMHFHRDCTYKQNKCKDCGLVGHREGYCSSAKKNPKSGALRRKGHPEAYSTKTVNLLVNTVHKHRRFIQSRINGVKVRLQLDTGSDISLISKQTWIKIGKPPRTPATERAATASGDPLEILFKCKCTTVINKDQRVVQFYVVNESLHLAGIDMLDSFGLWSVPINTYCNNVTRSTPTIDSLKTAFPAVFRNEVGLCNRTKIKLELKPEAVPVFRPKRPVAYAMYNTVDEELDRLERANIITPVEFSNWAAPIVVVRKANGTIRICGDYSTGLNDALQPHRYPLPLPEDIFAKLANCTVFSQIDLSDAFLQVEIEEASRDLLTINTHRGLYRYNRLPPGVKTAPGAFQQLMDTMLAGLPCTSGYLDDVIIGGKDEEEHARNLHAVLARIQEYGFTVRPENSGSSAEYSGQERGFRSTRQIACSFGNADVLSRLISQHVRPNEDYVIASVILEDDIRSVASDTIKSLPLNFKIVQEATQSDPIIKKVYRYLNEGWPDLKQVTDPEIKRFYDRQESLTTVQGCILFGERLVIPSPLRRRCIGQLHRGHPGIQRMKAIARSYVYWPSLDKDIVDHVKSCCHCASTAKSPSKLAPVPWPRSTKPWERVHIDYAGPITGDYYLIVVDSYTKWPEIIQTHSTTTAATIAILKDVFARFGMPSTLVSDNEPQFVTERFVDTFKRSIKKIQEGRDTVREALNTFLITYRTTPNPSTPNGKSPAEIMFGRRIRTSLELLRPPVERTIVQNKYYNVKRSYHRNDLVFAKLYSNKTWRWAPGIILEKVGSVMYNVWVNNQRLVRSHVNQLMNRFETNHHTKPMNNPSRLPIDILLAMRQCRSLSQAPAHRSYNQLLNQSYNQYHRPLAALCVFEECLNDISHTSCIRGEMLGLGQP